MKRLTTPVRRRERKIKLRCIGGAIQWTSY